MTVAELKQLLADVPDHIQVLVETQCGTLNTPKFENWEPGEIEFITLALPDTYDTYWGPVTK